jgi:hypothetical protein
MSVPQAQATIVPIIFLVLTLSETHQHILWSRDRRTGEGGKKPRRFVAHALGDGTGGDSGAQASESEHLLTATHIKSE